MLKDFRYNHLDDLPEKCLIPWDANYYKYKCRWNYMAGVRASIYNLIKENKIQKSENIEEWNKFIDYIANKDPNKFTTKQEIDMVNNLLDKVIEELETNIS